MMECNWVHLLKYLFYTVVFLLSLLEKKNLSRSKDSLLDSEEM